MTLFRHDCKVHGHRMAPRYDRKPGYAALLELADTVNLRNVEVADVVTYVKDICVRCGHTVPR